MERNIGKMKLKRYCIEAEVGIIDHFGRNVVQKMVQLHVLMASLGLDKDHKIGLLRAGI